MNTVIVLAMHGVPPEDFPHHETGELFRLHSKLERASDEERAELQARHDAIEDKMRQWPRTPANDPFYFGSVELAEAMERASGHPVMVAFNEFCAPSVEAALEDAIAQGAGQVLVITPMMTRGGGHSEGDIPQAIARAQVRYPHVTLRYAWPFATEEVADFLAGHVARFLDRATADRQPLLVGAAS